LQKRERHYETRLLLAAFVSRLSYNLPVKAIPERVQFYLLAFGNASILTFWALITFQRHLVELQDPAAASASSGMWAFGDALVSVGTGFLLLVPTFFLLRVMARHESAYNTYSKAALAITLTAPLALGLLASGTLHHAGFLENNTLLRLLYSPFVIIILAMSRMLARFPNPKRLLMYALSVESLTLLLTIAMFLVSARSA
jgi:hypothetical protein